MRHRLALIGAALALLALAFLVATVALFVRPAEDEGRRADALVVLGPGLSGERMKEGLRLLRRGAAPVLVISRTQDRGWDAASRLCSGAPARDVVCFEARPYTTRGEARTLARLARRRGWRSLIVVTSTYHATRARLLNRRCSERRVDVVAASPSASIVDWIGVVVHEWAGLAQALALERGC